MTPRLLPPDHPDAPKYWQNETSGFLVPVVKRYLDGQALTRNEVGLMKAYLWQWVKSPAWAPGGDLETLRLRVAAMKTYQDLNDAIRVMTDMGMDPL